MKKFNLDLVSNSNIFSLIRGSHCQFTPFIFFIKFSENMAGGCFCKHEEILPSKKLYCTHTHAGIGHHCLPECTQKPFPIHSWVADGGMESVYCVKKPKFMS